MIKLLDWMRVHESAYQDIGIGNLIARTEEFISLSWRGMDFSKLIRRCAALMVLSRGKP